MVSDAANLNFRVLAQPRHPPTPLLDSSITRLLTSFNTYGLFYWVDNASGRTWYDSHTSDFHTSRLHRRYKILAQMLDNSDSLKASLPLSYKFRCIGTKRTPCMTHGFRRKVMARICRRAAFTQELDGISTLFETAEAKKTKCQKYSIHKQPHISCFLPNFCSHFQ